MKKYLRNHPQATLLNILWLIVNTLLNTVTAVLFTFSTNAIFEKNLSKLFFWLGINLLTWLVVMVSEYFQDVSQEKLIQRLLVDLRADVSTQIAQSDINQFHQKNVGQYISHYINDAEIIENHSFHNFFGLVGDVAAVVFAAITLAMYHYLLLLTAVVLAVVMLVLPKQFRKRLSVATANLSQANGAFSNQITNLLNGFNVFFNANKLRLLPQRVGLAAESYGANKVAYTRVEDQVDTGINLISLICQMLVDVVTSVLAILGQIPLGAISSTGSIAASIFNGLKHLSKEQVQLRATEPLIQELQPAPKYAETSATSFSFQDKIAASHLSYQLAGQQIITNLNFVIKKSEKVAIVGHSGSGKSTLLKILNGQLKDYQGSVQIDGHELNSLSSQQISQISQYVDQDNYLFNDSITNNVTIWEAEPNRDQVAQSLSFAGVDFVDNCDMVISENGRNFSGGQQQRLALARSFFGPRAIACLDEVTSALDVKTAQAIDQRLLADSELTVVEVTHHLNPALADQYSQVISLDKEKI